jgi:hypothetical protein
MQIASLVDADLANFTELLECQAQLFCRYVFVQTVDAQS